MRVFIGEQHILCSSKYRRRHVETCWHSDIDLCCSHTLSGYQGNGLHRLWLPGRPFTSPQKQTTRIAIRSGLAVGQCNRPELEMQITFNLGQYFFVIIIQITNRSIRIHESVRRVTATIIKSCRWHSHTHSVAARVYNVLCYFPVGRRYSLHLWTDRHQLQHCAPFKISYVLSLFQIRPDIQQVCKKSVRIFHTGMLLSSPDLDSQMRSSPFLWD
jgi:hypothetical protein